MTEAETAQAIAELADKIFDAMPNDAEISDTLSALALVVALAICSSAGGKGHAEEGAQVFHSAMKRFIDNNFDLVASGVRH